MDSITQNKHYQKSRRIQKQCAGCYCLFCRLLRILAEVFQKERDNKQKKSAIP